MSEYYDRQGKAISSDVWITLIHDWHYKTVKKTTTKGLFVSTIWLGTNYNWSGNGNPVIFETMVFETDSSGNNGADLFCERYSTLEEAEKAHDHIVAQIIDKTFKGYSNE